MRHDTVVTSSVNDSLASASVTASSLKSAENTTPNVKTALERELALLRCSLDMNSAEGSNEGEQQQLNENMNGEGEHFGRCVRGASSGEF